MLSTLSIFGRTECSLNYTERANIFWVFFVMKLMTSSSFVQSLMNPLARPFGDQWAIKSVEFFANSAKAEGLIRSRKRTQENIVISWVITGDGDVMFSLSPRSWGEMKDAFSFSSTLLFLSCFDFVLVRPSPFLRNRTGMKEEEEE